MIKEKTKFIVKKIDNYYIPEIYWSDETCSFDMSCAMIWSIEFKMDTGKLIDLVIEKYNRYKEIKIGPWWNVPGWKTKEEVEVVIEYLESILIMQKLCS